MNERLDPCWQKARIAARILVRARTRPLSTRDRRLARWLAAQPGVTNRLIEQGIASVIAPWRWQHGRFIHRPRPVAA